MHCNSSRVFFKAYTGRGSCSIDGVQILGESRGHGAPLENLKNGVTDNAAQRHLRPEKFVIRSLSKTRSTLNVMFLQDSDFC